MSKKRGKGKRPSMRPSAPDFGLATLVKEQDASATDSLVPVSLPPGSVQAEAPDAATEAPATTDRPTVPDHPVATTSVPRVPTATVAASAPASRVEEEDADALAFFERAEAAAARAEEDARKLAALEEAAVAKPAPLPPELVARRALLRRVVSGVVGAAAVLSLVAGVSLATRSRSASAASTAPAVATVARVASPTTEPPAPEATQLAEPKAEPAKPTPADVDAKPAAAPDAKPVAAPDAKPVAAPDAKPPSDATPAPEADAKPAAKADPAAAKELTKKALSALERGAYKAAIEHGSASVDADPTDANAYLYWGTALMETGKRADAKQVFARCVETATRGPKHECRQFK